MKSDLQSYAFRCDRCRGLTKVSSYIMDSARLLMLLYCKACEATTMHKKVS